jgi:hypothetical protein
MSHGYNGPQYPLYRPAFLAVSNASGQDAHIVITLYNGGNTLTFSATVATGTLYKHDFTMDEDMTTIQNPRDSAGSVTTFATHITSDVKVTAYYMMNALATRDIFSLKGAQALGTLFYAPMQSDNAAQTGGYIGACDQIDIVATENNTLVEVIPTAPIVNTGDGQNPSPAGDTIRRTLDKGQTLKIMEQTINVGSLAGTKIIADKPVAVTVTEDLVKGDTSGDQIVPVSSLGSRYIVPRGYRTNTPTDRFYLVGAAPGTKVNIYTTGSSPAVTISLDEGETDYYYFTSGVNAVYVESNHPVYLYHRSGYGEEGAALLPSLYAIGQKQLSYYQVSGVSVQKGFAIFKAGMQSGFKISYGSTSNVTLNVGTPVTMPAMPDWVVGRFDLPSAANGRVVTIRNDLSPFAFGYITGDVPNNDSYGYFSAFGFELPDTTYMCTNAASVTLEGGYAMAYEWSYNGAPIENAQNITVSQEGEYTLKMNQDPTIVTVTTFVRMVNGGTICPDTIICTGTAPNLSVAGASGDRFQWQTRSDVNAQWTDIAGATSPTYTPGPLTAATYFRRGTTANECTMEYSGGMEVKISPCVLPVNPHLMIRYE